MNVATILPYRYMEITRTDPFQMCLAHLCTERREYASYYAGFADDPDIHVILDNGAAENGEPMGVDDLSTVIDVIQPTEVVLPDWPTKYERTSEIMQGASKAFAIRYPDLQQMAVPHGESITRWKMCSLIALSLPHVTCIGLSKFWLSGGLMEVRSTAFDVLPPLRTTDKAIHVLGVHHSLAEACETVLAHSGRVRSIDSSIAVIYTAAGKRITPTVPKPQDEFDPNWIAEDDAQLELLALNLTVWRGAPLSEGAEV